MASATAPYYAGRERSLAELFDVGEVTVAVDHLVLDGRRVPVIDDVIVMLPPARLPELARSRISHGGSTPMNDLDFAADIQYSFGAEWTDHGALLPEHHLEFEAYFDLVELKSLSEHRIGDLGCGSGRWAWFVAPYCRELVVTDFSDAIFVARANLSEHPNVIFVMADVLDLPFADDALDFAYCLGVLHHLPVDALEACRRLAPVTPELLVYLYYALDNRPEYFRWILRTVTAARRQLARVTNRRARNAVSFVLAVIIYAPLGWVGRIGGGLAKRYIPLADTYAGKSLRRLQQDAYDRFFTAIEQRFTREQIHTLEDTFGRVSVSDGTPYWHFLCQR